MTTYNDVPMNGISDTYFNTLLVHLGEQVTAVLQRERYPADEAAKLACDTLTQTWNHNITVRQWLVRVGQRLNVDTSTCMGA